LLCMRREHGMEGSKAVTVSSMIEDRPKIEVLSWRVATYSPTHGTIRTSHTPSTKSCITPLKNSTQTNQGAPHKGTNHAQQIGEVIKARRDRWYERSTAGGDWSVESAVCHSHAEKVTPTHGLHPNNSQQLSCAGEVIMNNAKKIEKFRPPHAVARPVMNARTNSLGGMWTCDVTRKEVAACDASRISPRACARTQVWAQP
jgi:hypothetical protein